MLSIPSHVRTFQPRFRSVREVEAQDGMKTNGESTVARIKSTDEVRCNFYEPVKGLINALYVQYSSTYCTYSVVIITSGNYSLLTNTIHFLYNTKQTIVYFYFLVTYFPHRSSSPVKLCFIL